LKNSLSIELHTKAQAWAAIKEIVFPFLTHWLRDGVRLVLKVEQLKRTPAQNRRYWGKGVLSQVTEQAVIKGRLFSADTWHEQFKRQFIGVIEMPDGTVRGKSSSDLSKAEFSTFCTEVEAYASSELGVTFYDLERH
jgi:hypothetical protein